MTDPLFLAFLAQHDDAAWLRAVDRLDAAMHPVDRTATRIWFHFYPMRLQRAVEGAPDPAALEHHLRLEGRWQLADHRDTSHRFLFGHRYWSSVCEAVRTFAARPSAPGSLDLCAQVQEIARDLSARLRVDRSWLIGITLVAVRSLQQVGLGDGRPDAPSRGVTAGDPDRVLGRRARDDSQGLFGFLKGRRKQWSVTFDEHDPAASFPLIDSQHLTTAAALDRRDHRATDPRCTEGPIPVQCRSCSCGTCWVGVLGGREKLSPVGQDERRTLAALGYSAAPDLHPVIRLACMAEASGAISIVIPPWNGQIGARLERYSRTVE